MMTLSGSRPLWAPAVAFRDTPGIHTKGTSREKEEAEKGQGDHTGSPGVAGPGGEQGLERSDRADPKQAKVAERCAIQAYSDGRDGVSRVQDVGRKHLKHESGSEEKKADLWCVGGEAGCPAAAKRGTKSQHSTQQSRKGVAEGTSREHSRTFRDFPGAQDKPV